MSVSVRGLRVHLLPVVLIAALAGLLAFGGAQALALTGSHAFALRFGSGEGSGDGQFGAGGMAGLAVSATTHDVYVVDKGNGRVERFSSTGAYLGQFDGSGTFEVEGKVQSGAPAADGKFSEPEYVAVDSSGDPLLDPSAGDVYVTDVGHHVIDKFTATGEYLGELTGSPSGAFTFPQGIAVDPAGNVWVSADDEVFEFTDALSNEFVTSWPSDGTTGEIIVNPQGGAVYIRAVSRVHVIEFSESGSLVTEEFQEASPVRGIAVDESNGELFFDMGEFSEPYPWPGKFVSVYEPGGGAFAQQPTFGSGDLTAGGGMAVDSSTGAVYVADSGSDTIVKFSLLPSVKTEAPSGLTGTSATLNGTVDPNGTAVKSCEFEYGTEAGVYTHTVACAQTPGEIGERTAGVPVSAEVSGLQPDVVYHFRLVVGNASGGLSYGDDEIVPAPPVIEGESVADVASTSATFSARIDPNGADTAYYFQYGTSEAYGSVAPIPDGDAGSGLSGSEVSVHVQGLSPSTTYHYRVIASNIVTPQPLVGEDHSFRTQVSGEELALLDGRQWELVSPVDKHGASFSPLSTWGVIQSSASGGAMTYLASQPIEAEPGGGFHEFGQVLSERGPGGWRSRDIATAHREPSGPVLEHGEEYRFFSEDLSLGLVEPWGGFTSLAPEVFPQDTERTLYLRHDDTCESTPGTCYMPLVTGAPGYSDVPAGTKFGGDPTAPEGELRFEGATPDLGHVVLFSGVPLDQASSTREGLYEWSAGKPLTEELPLVSVLPDGTAAQQANLGRMAPKRNSRHAISDDGSRVFWTSEESHPPADHLYMRDMVNKHTIQLDVPQPGAPSQDGIIKPVYQTASSDGSRVFFTDEQPLTVGSGARGEPELYECAIVETAGEDECVLSDLTPEVSGQPADVQGGVVGSSEDGSYVYFVADGVLSDVANSAGEKAVAGSCSNGPSQPSGAICNMYMSHYDASSAKWEEPVFIAVLSGEDDPNWSVTPVGLTARVSPDGQWLSFMSGRSLTGYDNRDANSGQPDEEVYVYRAETSESGQVSEGKLACASCDPTGARPVGVEWSRLQKGLAGGSRFIGWANGTWLAANVPAWTAFGSLLGVTDAVYQSRYLSDEGRLFFNSSDALVSQDIDGTEDVYEYEPPGTGSCTVSSPTFGAASGGCVDLVSSGTSSYESAFLDASEGGGDVFFLTSEKLVPQDIGNGTKVYDAHMCTVQSPCFSEPPPPPPCTTADSCRAALIPQPSIFGAPSSSTFSGVGNIAPPLPPARKPKTVKCPKGKHLSHNKCVKHKKAKKKTKATRSARGRK